MSRHLVGSLGVGDAGVVDEDVDEAERFVGVGHALGDRLRVGDVEGDRDAFPAARLDLLGDLLELVHAPTLPVARQRPGGRRQRKL